MQPWFVVQDSWRYLIAAVIGLVALCSILAALTGLIERRWVSHLHRKYHVSLGGFTLNWTATAYNLMSIAIFAITAYFMQFGYTFGWLAIVAAAEIFTWTNTYGYGDAGRREPSPTQMQVDAVYVGLILDVLQAVVSAGAAVLFRDLVVVG